MTKEEVIGRFCALSAKVMSKQFKCDEPADCFCTERPKWHEPFQFSPEVTVFIEEAVNEKLEAKDNPDIYMREYFFKLLNKWREEYRKLVENKDQDMAQDMSTTISKADRAARLKACIEDPREVVDKQ